MKWEFSFPKVHEEERCKSDRRSLDRCPIKRDKNDCDKKWGSDGVVEGYSEGYHSQRPKGREWYYIFRSPP